MISSVSQDVVSSARASLVSTWRTMNTSLDGVFYDTAALSSRERSTLSAHVDAQGMVLVVYPGNAGRPIAAMTPLQFTTAEQKQSKVSTIVVAGVGSSALGTACLARNVANYLGEPVAGIVSGLGLADVGTEAFGGWFVFGAANVIRDLLARTLQFFVVDHVRDQATHDDMKRHLSEMGLSPEFFIYGSPDSTALLYLLSKLGSKIKLLVGHSKGNYSIENALEGLQRVSKVPENIKVITLSAVIWFDPQVVQLNQFIGNIDAFGMLNSRPDVRCAFIPGAWHSLNSALPGHLSVAQALSLAGLQPAHASRPLGASPPKSITSPRIRATSKSRLSNELVGSSKN